MCVRRSRTGTQLQPMRSDRATPGSDQTRRTVVRDEDGRGGWTLNGHHPAVLASVSGLIEADWKSTSGAATDVDSVWRASVTNGVMTAASWQRMADSIC